MICLEYMKKLLVIVITIFFYSFSLTTNSAVLGDCCTTNKVRTAVSIASFMFSAGAFLWVHRENKIIEALERESEEAKQRVSELTQSITSIKSCMAQLVEGHKQTDKIPLLMSLEALSVNQKILPVFFQYSDPTKYLFRHSKSLSSARFYPVEISFVKFDSCDQVHSFFDNSLENIEVSEDGVVEEWFVHKVFNLSLLFCGGFVRDVTFSSEHPCYVLVHAYMHLTDEKDNEIFEVTNNLLSYSNYKNDSVIHLPVMGAKHKVLDNVYSYHSHLVWLEIFHVNKLLQIKRSTQRNRFY